MMVGAHPRLAVPLSTTGLWYRYGRLLDHYDQLGTAANVELLVQDLLQEERIRLWDVKLSRDSVLKGLTPCSYPTVIARFHSLYAQSKGKDLWGNIDIATLDDMDMAASWFPRARFIHIVRDGRDVALSHETMPYGTSNVAECALRWTQRLHTNLKMGAILGPNRYLVVRYEDLVLDTKSALRRMCEFLDLSYSAQMLEYTSMVKQKIPDDRRWLWPALDQPPVESKVYRWKREMSETKRIVFENTADKMLSKLGYETYSRIPKRASAYLLELWYFLGQRGRFRRFAAKLGLQRPSRLERQWQAKKKP